MKFTIKNLKPEHMEAMRKDLSVSQKQFAEKGASLTWTELDGCFNVEVKYRAENIIFNRAIIGSLKNAFKKIDKEIVVV